MARNLGPTWGLHTQRREEMLAKSPFLELGEIDHNKEKVRHTGQLFGDDLR